MRIHRRQFVVGPRPVQAAESWVVKYIPGVGYLSHCPELPIVSQTDRNGTLWHLLGLAVQTKAEGADPRDVIAVADGETIEHSYETWAGRWVLIGGGHLHMDAAGLLGCFYRVREGAAAAKDVWVSSSPALLGELLSLRANGARPLGHALGMDWYPPPLSRLEHLGRLLPSQILNLTDGALIPRRLFPTHTAELDYPAALETLRNYLVTALRNAARRCRRTLWLPLTAGLDSRLLLAAAHAANVRIKTYTHSNRFINEADLTIPPKLAAAVGVEHHVFRGGPFAEELARLHDEHTGGHHVGQDRDYIARDQFAWSEDGDMILRGGAFEIGRCYYWPKFPQPSGSWVSPNASSILQGFRNGNESTFARAIQEWVSWAGETPHENLDWRDRFYLEQRLAGWLSSVEQALDLIPAERFIAANSRSYVDTVLQVPEPKRRSSLHHTDLIEMMAPALSGFPVNPRQPLRKKIVSRLNRMYARRVRSLQRI